MREKNTRKRSVKADRTDWARIDAIKDEEIDYSGNPKLADNFFSRAIRWPGVKKQLTMRIDPDVLDFFKSQGRGYQTAMNAVLRSYMESRRRATGKRRVVGGR